MQSALLPAICPVYLCTSVGLWGATCCSACPVLCHSESGPLGFSVHECGPAGSASGQTACPVRTTLHQSWSHHGHASPLHPSARLCPSYRSGSMFLFYVLGVGLPCCSILLVLVLRGGAVCPPTPPSWFSIQQDSVHVSPINVMGTIYWTQSQGYENTAYLSSPDIWVREPDCLHLPYIGQTGAPQTGETDRQIQLT